MLRHIRPSQIYWFCRHCRQEMPVLNLNKTSSFFEQLEEENMKKVFFKSKDITITVAFLQESGAPPRSADN